MSKYSKYLVCSFTLLFAVIVLANHAHAQGNVSKSIQSLNNYSSPLFGFQFQYPKDFPQIDEGHNWVGFTFNDTHPKYGLNTISIGVNDLQEPVSLRKYLRAYIYELAQVKRDTLIVSQTTIGPEKIPAIKAEFQVGSKDENFGKSVIYITMKDNAAYITHYYCDDKVFENHLPGLQTIIDTFKIT